MTITDKAAQKLKDILIEQFINTGVGFRITNHDDESINKAIDIKLDHEKPGDKIVNSHGLKIFIDPETAASLGDYNLDWNDPDSTLYLKSKPPEIK